MTDFSAADHRYMARALQLARKGVTSAHPNPRVGCVLVKDGEVVGEGWHRKAGEAHAEVNALTAAGGKAAGATAYVTLEPCVRTDRTGPCAQALIDAGIAEVVFALDDPSQRTSGAGRTGLEEAGVRIRSGLMQAEARRLNEGFLSRVERHRPYLRLKIAASLDGGTAMASGESRWITDEAARRDVQELRAASGAILTGVGTVIADDPYLTVRPTAGDSPPVQAQPLRVIVDSRLRTPTRARMLNLPGATAIFCVDDRNRGNLEKPGVSVYRAGSGNGKVDLPAMLARLAELEINDVLVEAGPALLGSLLTVGLVDELVISQAPHITGSETRRMFLTPSRVALEDRQKLAIADVRQVGTCLRVTARPVDADKNDV